MVLYSYNLAFRQEQTRFMMNDIFFLSRFWSFLAFVITNNSVSKITESSPNYTQITHDSSPVIMVLKKSVSVSANWRYRWSSSSEIYSTLVPEPVKRTYFQLVSLLSKNSLPWPNGMGHLILKPSDRLSSISFLW